MMVIFDPREINIFNRTQVAPEIHGDRLSYSKATYQQGPDFMEITQIAAEFSPEQCAAIRDVHISLPSLVSTRGLGLFPNVEHVSICRCQVGEILDLHPLKSLESFEAYENPLDGVVDFSACTALKRLALSTTKINQWQQLVLPDSIELLSWRESNLTTLKNLPILPVLEKLDLGLNDIEQIEALEKLPSLKIVNLLANPVKQIADATRAYLLSKIPGQFQLTINPNDAVLENFQDVLPLARKIEGSGGHKTIRAQKNHEK